MKKIHTSVLVVISILSAFSAFAEEQKFDSISRCFFIYGAIFEVGRDLPHAEMFHFGQVRTAYIAGYLQANKFNSNFEQVFNRNLKVNKQEGLQLESLLVKAISVRDQAQFSLLINRAVVCDRQLGIHTEFLPKM